MKRICAFLLLTVLASGCAATSSPLTDFVNAPDPSFRWSVQSSAPGSELKSAVLSVTSQTWQGTVWKHAVEVVTPENPRRPSIALLIVTAGKPGDRESVVARAVAARVGCPAAVVYGIPNQPLFGDLREDALIAHTFQKTLETKDQTWPLLLPMTKSVVRAMDAIQAFAKRTWSADIRGFVVTGASKRGWTTWLTAAADPKRVKGIVPVVYDNLDLPAQMAHQRACYGAYSEMIGDYTKLDLPGALATPAGEALCSIVDPRQHKSALSVPKIIVNGANDPYWVVDSLNLYWPALRGHSYVMYYANGGHDLGIKGAQTLPRAQRLVDAYEGLITSLEEGSYPKVSWSFEVKDGQERLLVLAGDEQRGDAKLWTARSESRDFRKSVWTSAAMERTPDGWSAPIALPKSGYLAAFADFPAGFGGQAVTLSTQVRVYSPAGPVGY